MPPLDPRALIFDMDGLMIDSEPLWWDIERRLASDHGHTWTDEMAHPCIGTGLPNTIATMRERLGLQLGIEEGVGWLVDSFIARVGELKLQPGCLELIDAASSAELPVAVASSSTMRLIEAVLDRFSIAERFAATVSGESVAHPKPAPDIFLSTAEQLGVSADGCIVLEDSLAGVTAAVAAEMTVLAVPELDHASFEPLTPYVLRDLHQARSLLGL